jgi:hypothetical protein
MWAGKSLDFFFLIELECVVPCSSKENVKEWKRKTKLPSSKIGVYQVVNSRLASTLGNPQIK